MAGVFDCSGNFQFQGEVGILGDEMIAGRVAERWFKCSVNWISRVAEWPTGVKVVEMEKEEVGF